MSTLTWITEKELEWEIKKQLRPILLKEKHENVVVMVRNWEMLVATKVKMSGSERKKWTGTGTPLDLATKVHSTVYEDKTTILPVGLASSGEL